MKKYEKCILIIMIAIFLLFWPIGIYRVESSERSGDFYHAETPMLEVGMTMTQKFTAMHNHVKTIEFALDFDEEQDRVGELLFLVSDKKGNILYQETIPYDAVAKYTYYPVEVDLHIKLFHTYEYSITNLTIEDNQPRGIYTASRRMHVLPNRKYYCGDEIMMGQALTRYTWIKPLPFCDLLAVAGCIGCAGFTLMEIIKNSGRRSSEVQDK